MAYFVAYYMLQRGFLQSSSRGSLMKTASARHPVAKKNLPIFLLLLSLVLCAIGGSLNATAGDSPFKSPDEVLKALQKMAAADPEVAKLYASPEAVFKAMAKAAQKGDNAEVVSYFLPGLWILAAKEGLNVDFDSDLTAFNVIDSKTHMVGRFKDCALNTDGKNAKQKGEPDAKIYGYSVDGKPSGDTQLFVKRGKLWLLAN